MNTIQGKYTSQIKLLFFLDQKIKDFSPSLYQKPQTVDSSTQTENQDVPEKPKCSLIRPIVLFSQKNESNEIETEEKKTENTFLGKKREFSIEIEKTEKTEKSNEITTNDGKIEKKKRLGRKTKKEKAADKTIYLNTHSIFSEDNIMKKVKTNIFESVRQWLNVTYKADLLQQKETPINNTNMETLSDSFSQTQNSETKISPCDEAFLRLNFKEVINNINRDYNLKIIDCQIKEIFSSDINDKYKQKDKNHNKRNIDKILTTDDERFKGVKSILNLTFREVLEIFNNNISEEIKIKINEETLNSLKKIECFLEKIKNQEKEKKEINDVLIDIYIKSAENLCRDYEGWFKRRVNKRNKKIEGK